MATKPTRFAQMGDTTEKVKAYTGIPKQLVVDTSKWKIHLMDGSTPGGFEVAMAADVTREVSALSEELEDVTMDVGDVKTAIISALQEVNAP